MTAACGAALSRHPIAATATGEVAGALLEAVGPGADQVFLFASRHHTGTLEDVVGAVGSILDPGTLTTATSDLVIGGTQVVGDGPALAAFATRFPPEATATVHVPGCRPIGEPMVVTAAEGSLLLELASEPALVVLRRLLDGLSPPERALAAGGLHIGVVRDEHLDRFGPGDFAVHAVLGAVTERDAVAIGDDVAVGTTAQFQVAGAATARRQLGLALADGAAGALLLTGPGRPSPTSDAELLTTTLGPAVAGMAVDGEIGSASVLLFGARG